MNDYFQITEKDGFRLTVPSHSAACSNDLWNNENHWLRSRLETLAGEVCSQGFGKFFNLNQGPEGLKITLDDIIAGIKARDAVATLKLDGSALFVSSFENRKIVRTRGSMGYEHQKNAHEVEGFRGKYPILFDLDYMRGFTLLCEWCTPSQQIVIKYPEPTLKLVGGVDNKLLKYLTINELEMVSTATGIKLVDNFPLSSDNFQELLTNIQTNQDIEGYVIRLNGQQRLVKIKCPPYCEKHSLKSNLTMDKLASAWYDNNCPDFNGFVEVYKKQYDEETVMWILPAINNLMTGVVKYKEILNKLGLKTLERRNWTRKDFAIQARQEYGAAKEFSVLMSLYSNIPPERRILKQILLEHTTPMTLGIFEK